MRPGLSSILVVGGKDQKQDQKIAAFGSSHAPVGAAIFCC
ncbi:hypothetical protein PGR6_31230 [Pseudomonas sp. GR 6-02]|nr:hypothetical protein PGR6_31230 [Pseudomonas sp. GR 6-02]